MKCRSVISRAVRDSNTSAARQQLDAVRDPVSGIFQAGARRQTLSPLEIMADRLCLSTMTDACALLASLPIASLGGFIASLGGFKVPAPLTFTTTTVSCLQCSGSNQSSTAMRISISFFERRNATIDH